MCYTVQNGECEIPGIGTIIVYLVVCDRMQRRNQNMTKALLAVISNRTRNQRVIYIASALKLHKCQNLQAV
jgi:hypothetical protein